ncbi:hypothetical protein IKE79_00795 [Candidatus Saccharibacteria bacterium]|nr:hypothetical protein [Candidatus Saccharibacteria bacterium]
MDNSAPQAAKSALDMDQTLAAAVKAASADEELTKAKKAKKAKKPKKSKEPKSPKALKSPTHPKNGKKRFALVVFFVGLVTLIGGAVFLVLNMLKEPVPRDAEYLVTIGTWQRQDAPSVIWDFTEIGKGTLTTNDHTNDYNFIWAMEGDKIKIETDWLYTLNNEYTYALDQTGGELTLTSNDGSITLIPAMQKNVD